MYNVYRRFKNNDETEIVRFVVSRNTYEEALRECWNNLYQIRIENESGKDFVIKTV